MLLESRVDTLRAFNRCYTEVLGLLDDGLLRTPYPLVESRILFELGTRGTSSPTGLADQLHLDPGYVSRVLARLKEQGLVHSEPSPGDGRRQVIGLTQDGSKTFGVLNERSSQQIRELLLGLSEDGQERLTSAAREIRSLLGKNASPLVVLRAPVTGDHGWVIQRHGELYAREFHWDETFEAMVARILADHIDHRDPKHESGWIAEVDGQRVGCVFCMKRQDDVAQLRLLLVEPAARQMGLGSRLVQECIRFAKRAGYREMMLWTNDVLTDARKIYERNGFRLLEEERHHSFGRDLVGQNWTLDL